MDTILALFIIIAGLGLILAAAAFLIWRRQQSAQPISTPPTKKARKPAERRPDSVAPPDDEKKEQPAPSAEPAAAPPQPAASSPSPEKPAPVPAPAPAKQYNPEDVTEKIRILIVDDNRETIENVSRLLYFEKDVEVIGQAVNGRQGLDMAAELKPHIVLMDINMPDMDGIEATQQMSGIAPFSQVIVMSVQAEQHYMRQAMTAGAREFQPKPFTADELISCIRRVYKRGLPMYQQFDNVQRAENQQAAARPKVETTEGDKESIVVAIYSPKGGMGTSTIAANLAVALQKEYGDVVLVDADLQFGDIMVHLNTKVSRSISDLIYESEFDIELLQDVLLVHSSGLKLLLAPTRPELADAILPEMLTEIIKSLKQQYKFVVIDTDNNLADKTVQVLEAADYIMVVSAPELPAIKNTKLFLELANLLEFESDRISVILNKVGIPGGISPEKIQAVLKLDHIHRIPYDPRIHMAINRGVAVNQQDAMAPSAQAITQIARELGQHLVIEQPAPVEKEAV